MWDKRDAMRVHQKEPYNAESPSSALLDQITALDAFYGRNHGPIPRLDTASWRLCVTGLVARPLELSMDDLRHRFPERSLVATLLCAGNRRADLMAIRDIPGQVPWGVGATSTALWRGVSLADVLAEAGIRDQATHIAFTGADTSRLADPPQRFGASVPRLKATSPEVLLAWSMNDRPLPIAHGGPLRVIVPGWIGARSVKWLQLVTAQVGPSDNYFQTEYSVLPADADPRTARPGEGITLGPITIHCAILRPDDGAQLPAGATEVAGFAIAGEDRTVARVDVSGDGGRTWLPADLDSPRNPWTWQHWRATLTLPVGETDILARAWDSTGAVQPASPATVWNPRGYANSASPHVHVTCRP